MQIVTRSNPCWQQSKEEAKRILADVLETPNLKKVSFHLTAAFDEVMEATYAVTVSIVPRKEK